MPAPQVSQAYMQIELKCSKAFLIMHAVIMNPMFIYYSLNHQTPGNRKRQRSTKPKWTIIPGRWQATDYLKPVQVATRPGTHAKASSTRGLSWQSWLGPGEGQLLMDKSKLGVSRAWMRYVSRDPSGPFSDIKPEIYLKDYGEKSTRKWICTDWMITTQVEGNREAQLNLVALLDHLVEFCILPAALCVSGGVHLLFSVVCHIHVRVGMTPCVCPWISECTYGLYSLFIIAMPNFKVSCFEN